MNTIIEKQNESRFIAYLKAQRVAYSQCKSYQIFDSISLFLAILLPFAGLINSELVKYFGAFGVIWTIFYLIVEHLRKNKSKQGASIQEEFDVQLFEIPWNQILCGDRINNDMQRDLAAKYKGDDLKNWYSLKITMNLPRELAVLLCQRINFSWEISLKRKFINTLITILSLYYGSIILVAIIINFGILDTLIILSPSLSFLIFCIKNISALRTQSKSKKDNLNLIDSILDEYSKTNKLPSDSVLRQIQDVIFNNRNVPEKIPDWFYKKYRNSNELRTDEIIKSLKQKFLCQY